MCINTCTDGLDGWMVCCKIGPVDQFLFLEMVEYKNQIFYKELKYFNSCSKKVVHII
jgi:hypothetical protein